MIGLLSLRFLFSVNPKIALIIWSREPPFFFFPSKWTGSTAQFSTRLLLCPSPSVGSSSTLSPLSASTFTCTPVDRKAASSSRSLELFGAGWQMKFVASPWQCWHWKVGPTTRSVLAPFFETPCIDSWPINNHIYEVKRFIYIKTNTNDFANYYVKIMFSTYHNCICSCRITSYNCFHNEVPSHSHTSKELGKNLVPNLQSLIFLPKLFFLIIFICT